MHKVLTHPLVKHRVAMLRDRNTPPAMFRALVKEITAFLAYEALQNAETRKVPVITPVAETEGERLAGRYIVVPILRAGMGMLDAMLSVLPEAAVGVLGIQRNETTAEPTVYCAKMPPEITGDEQVILIDPMLATGGSACDAVAQLRKYGCKNITMLNLIAAPEGIAKFEAENPEVDLYVAALDERLNERFYIVPGLGDAGDRIFGTEGTAACRN